jgi:hypothetical protein
LLAGGAVTDGALVSTLGFTGAIRLSGRT